MASRCTLALVTAALCIQSVQSTRLDDYHSLSPDDDVAAVDEKRELGASAGRGRGREVSSSGSFRIDVGAANRAGSDELGEEDEELGEELPEGLQDDGSDHVVLLKHARIVERLPDGLGEDEAEHEERKMDADPESLVDPLAEQRKRTDNGRRRRTEGNQQSEDEHQSEEAHQSEGNQQSEEHQSEEEQQIEDEKTNPKQNDQTSLKPNSKPKSNPKQTDQNDQKNKKSAEGDKKPPCPIDIDKYQEHSDCGKGQLTKEACKPGHELYKTAQTSCKKMCNPDCNPAGMLQVSFTQAAYIPLGTIVRGHKYCQQRYTISTMKGDKKNRATGAVVEMPVCAQCLSDKYYLAPAYSSGGQIFGNCYRLTDHHLWRRAILHCNSTGKTCTEPTSGYNQCMQYQGGLGNHEHKFQGTENRLPKIHHGTDEEKRTLMASAFTCARTYVTTPTLDSKEPVEGRASKTYHIVKRIYNIVQVAISSCHSAEEDAKPGMAPRMECANKRILRSCHVYKFKVRTITPKKNNRISGKSLEVQSASSELRKQQMKKSEDTEKQARKNLKNKGPDFTGTSDLCAKKHGFRCWQECTPFDASIRTSV